MDIHAGGEDLVFPHHENEIAQSEACNGKEFARYWMHNAFLNIDNKKMSKSAGNFFTVREIGEQFDLQVLRFFMLSSHYRSPLNFSRDLMESAKASLERIKTAAYHLEQLEAVAEERELNEEEKAVLAQAESLNEKFNAAMEDDFNTADAISAIFEIVKLSNSNATKDNAKQFIHTLLDKIVVLCDILGVEVKHVEELLDEDIERLIEERQAARKNRDFARADEIRNELLEKGIILEDSREGVRWKRA